MKKYIATSKNIFLHWPPLKKTIILLAMCFWTQKVWFRSIAFTHLEARAQLKPKIWAILPTISLQFPRISPYPLLPYSISYSVTKINRNFLKSAPCKLDRKLTIQRNQIKMIESKHLNLIPIHYSFRFDTSPHTFNTSYLTFDIRWSIQSSWCQFWSN